MICLPRDDRGVEHPKQLIGVAIGMATGTGESGSGGGLAVLKQCGPLEIRMRGIMQVMDAWSWALCGQ